MWLVRIAYHIVSYIIHWNTENTQWKRGYIIQKHRWIFANPACWCSCSLASKKTCHQVHCWLLTWFPWVSMSYSWTTRNFVEPCNFTVWRLTTLVPVAFERRPSESHQWRLGHKRSSQILSVSFSGLPESLDVGPINNTRLLDSENDSLTLVLKMLGVWSPGSCYIWLLFC